MDDEDRHDSEHGRRVARDARATLDAGALLAFAATVETLAWDDLVEIAALIADEIEARTLAIDWIGWPPEEGERSS